MTAFTVEQTDWAQDAARLAAVRRHVFILEQGVPEEMEWDTADATAVHFLALAIEGQPIGCARLLPDGHIGRMAVLPNWRRLGVGSALLAAALTHARNTEIALIRLSAQVQAVPFYLQAGFVIVGDSYQEAGIPHVSMHKHLSGGEQADSMQV
ncbi:MAG: GNAT family N-acetyltransferase [Thiobacillus sp.]|nr:GNAT family N-acetyltransferase [Thiobacillus sp.]